MQSSIYVLIDPRYPNHPRYVGMTAKPHNRIYQHLNNGVDAVKDWLCLLRSCGTLAELKVLAWVPAGEAALFEDSTIAAYRDYFPLLNRDTPLRYAFNKPAALSVADYLLWHESLETYKLPLVRRPLKVGIQDQVLTT